MRSKRSYQFQDQGEQVRHWWWWLDVFKGPYTTFKYKLSIPLKSWSCSLSESDPAPGLDLANNSTATGTSVTVSRPLRLPALVAIGTATAYQLTIRTTAPATAKHYRVQCLYHWLLPLVCYFCRHLQITRSSIKHSNLCHIVTRQYQMIIALKANCPVLVLI